MNKLKLYAIGAVVIILILLAVFLNIEHKSHIRERDRADRLEENQRQLLASTSQQTTLILTLREFLSVDALKIDSLSKALKIRPKTITQYITIEKTIHDTVPKIVKVYPLKDSWVLTDSDKCWRWSGEAKLQNELMTVNRLRFDYNDKITEFFYWERPRKFLFVRYGKKRYYQKTSSECGTEKVLTIDIKPK